MCKLNKYTDVLSGNRVIYQQEHELCSRSRNGKPCDRAQEFRYPTEHIEPERLSPRVTYEQFPPTPPRSSRSPSTSDSERPRRRSETYYISGTQVDVNHKPPSPRRDRAEHVAFETTSVPRNATRRLEVPSSRRPPSPYEEDFDVYETYREQATDNKSTSSTSSKLSTSSKASTSSKNSTSSKASSKTSHGSSRDKDDKERETSVSPARTTKKVTIAENPSHKKHRHHGSKSSGSRENSGSDDEDNKVRYYTPGEEVQERINRQNKEIANRPAAPSTRPSLPPPPPAASSRTPRYRRPSVQIDDSMAITNMMGDLELTRRKELEAERRLLELKEREDRAQQDRLRERLRRNTIGGGSSASTALSPRMRGEIYR